MSSCFSSLFHDCCIFCSNILKSWPPRARTNPVLPQNSCFVCHCCCESPRVGEGQPNSEKVITEHERPTSAVPPAEASTLRGCHVRQVRPGTQTRPKHGNTETMARARRNNCALPRGGSLQGEWTACQPQARQVDGTRHAVVCCAREQRYHWLLGGSKQPHPASCSCQADRA